MEVNTNDGYTGPWRCFFCDAILATRKEAIEHFWQRSRQRPHFNQHESAPVRAIVPRHFHMKYRKKPVVIDAFQMTEAARNDNRDWPEWLNEAWQKAATEVGALFIRPMDETRQLLAIATMEGPLMVSWNDWIIRGVNGELYPCKPDIFEKTYEAV